MVDGDVIAKGEDIDPTLLNEMFPVHIERSSVPVDLSSGSAIEQIILHAERAVTIKKCTLLYTEASSADAGVAIKIGKETDDDYYYTGTSEVSKAKWYSLDVTLLQTDLIAGDTLILTCPGGKTGTGEIMLIVEYYYTVA